jgi:tricorn protease
VVGQPTAGWIIFTSPEPLIDGSTVRVPSTRIRDLAGQDMEMHPRPVDVVVRREPGQGSSTSDSQLAAAVAVLLKQIDQSAGQ